MTTPDTFDLALGASDQLRSRFDNIFDKVRADAASAGLSITPADLKGCPSVKLAVFSEMGLDSAEVLTELRRLPHIAEMARKADVARQLERGEGEVHAELQAMNRYQRLTVGHEINASRAAERAAMPAPSRPTAEEEAKLLLMLRRLPPAERISAARAAGLL